MNIPSPQNPYSAPLVTDPLTPGREDLTAMEQIRKSHLNHEASIKSFGFLYYLGGGFAVLAALIMLGGMIVGAVNRQFSMGSDVAFMIGMGIVYLALGVGQILVGRGLRRLQANARTGGTLFGILGLIGFPIGTIISGYFLYLLWSEKGKMIFSPEYKKVVEATPHIVYKTSKIVWAFAILLLLVIILGVVAAVLGA